MFTSGSDLLSFVGVGSGIDGFDELLGQVIAANSELESGNGPSALAHRLMEHPGKSKDLPDLSGNLRT